jgi:hypothetical protein
MSKLIKKGKLLFKSERFIAKGLVLATLILLTAVPYAYSLKNSGYGYGYGYSGYGYGYGYADAVPSAVTSLTCSAASTTSISCSWTAPSTTINGTSLDNLTGYRYTYSTSSNSTCNTGGSTTTSTSATISNLSVGTTYYVAVCAYDDMTNYSAAATTSATTAGNSSGTGGGPGATTTTTTTTTSGTASATITAASGGVVSTTTPSGYAAATANIPAGALSSDGVVSVQALGTSDVSAPAPAGSGAFLIAGLIFNFTVDGGSATFNEPVTLTFTYSDLQVEGLDENALAAYQWNDTTGAWEELASTVDPINNTITAETTHFSTFAIMTSTGGAVVGGSNIPVQGDEVDQAGEIQAVADFTEITGAAPSTTEDWRIVHFMVYGASAESKNMSQRDRKGVITDFVDTYGRVPSTTTDWNDIAKILSSHKPTQRSLAAEQKALIDFGKVYKRMPDYTNVYDEWALYYMAYNIRPNNRNLDSERFSIGVFKTVYGSDPTTADDWAIVRAIAYTGASR